MARKPRIPAPAVALHAKSKRVQQRYFSINELAAHLGISRRAVYGLIESGVFSPPRRIGKMQRFDMHRVQAQLDAMFEGADVPTVAAPIRDRSGRLSRDRAAM